MALLLFVLAALMVAGTRTDAGGGFSRVTAYSYEIFEHGWPVVALKRTVLDSPNFGAPRQNRWKIWEGDKEWSASGIAINATCFAVASALIVLYASWKTKKGETLKVTMLEVAGTILLLSIVLASLGTAMHQAAKSRDQVILLERNGAQVNYEYRGPRWFARLVGDVVGENMFGVELHGPQDIDLSDIEVAKADALRHPLARVGKIRSLYVVFADWEPSEMNRILSWASVCEPEAVCLQGSQISDAQVQIFAGSSRLRSLDLSSTQVTDRLATSLASCNHLQTLDVADTYISPDGIRSLLDLPAIREIRLSESELLDDRGLERQAASAGVRLISE